LNTVLLKSKKIILKFAQEEQNKFVFLLDSLQSIYLKNLKKERNLDLQKISTLWEVATVYPSCYFLTLLEVYIEPHEWLLPVEVSGQKLRQYKQQ